MANSTKPGICTWVRWCPEPGVHQVWRETRPGLIVDDVVCERHLDDASTLGYRLAAPPVAAPHDVDAEEVE